MEEWPASSQWSLSRVGALNATQPAMGPGTREWVVKTLAASAFTRKDELRSIASLLSTLETGRVEEERLIKEEILAHFLQALDNPDLAKLLVNAGALQHVISAMLGSRFTGVRKLAAQVFTNIAQNNPTVQNFAHGQGVLNGLLTAIVSEQDVGTKEAFVSSLSALVRGEFDKARRDFVQTQGLEVLRDVVLQPVSLRIVKKSLLLLINLFYYDKQVTTLQIYEKAADLGYVTILLSMENHEDTEVRQMSLQALQNLMLRRAPGSQDISNGLTHWKRRVHGQPDRLEEVSVIEDILRSFPPALR